MHKWARVVAANVLLELETDLGPIWSEMKLLSEALHAHVDVELLFLRLLLPGGILITILAALAFVFACPLGVGSASLAGILALRKAGDDLRQVFYDFCQLCGLTERSSWFCRSRS